MARTLNMLTAKAVAALNTPGRHADGGGLYLDVSAAGTRTWVLLYRSPVHRTERGGKQVGRQREMGLGPFSDDPKKAGITLAAARALATEARRLILAGLDPLDERHKPAPAEVRVPTFGAVADELIASMAASWRNDKHRAQWAMTLREYAKPLREMPVNTIETADVLSVLKPHWSERPETASRLRQRIERVLNAAKAAGHRSGENPAAWRGHLENLLPARQKLSRGHHAAMAIDDVPGFVGRLRAREGVACRCLEFAILTAARSGEALGARWSEIDTVARVWVIPAARMKAQREHRVPLTARALAILDEMRALRVTEGAEFVFSGQRPSRPLSSMALEMVLRRMKVADDATAHGFRSSFRDWAGNRTSFPRELAEHSLAHVIGDKAEQAYRRDDALERRRPMMEAWATFCDGVAGVNVVPLRPVREAAA